jgi:import inner membrane translocase subunit TIM13
MAAKKDAVMNAVRQEIALANAQELMNVRGSSGLPVSGFNQCIQKASDRCFLKCVTKPGTSLSSSEQVCTFDISQKSGIDTTI